MEIKDLRFFVAVYEHKGCSRAARALDTVQSNVSARLMRLEAELNVKLFERLFRSIQATEHGIRLYHYAKQILQLFDAIEAAVKYRDAA